MAFQYDLKKANAEALEYVRKELLDIFNRLHSILEDVRFVDQVHKAYPDLPMLPNMRCGAWYVDPAIVTHEPAYFKSTDGHFGNWSFNLRRPNLHLLPLAVARGGLVLVDSTRAGKRIPDALSKTVPIWCAVINRAMLRLHPEKAELNGGWDTELYCPPGAVSEQERSQMMVRLDEWADALARSSYTLPDLPRPLRPIWITPATSVFPKLPGGDGLQYIPVVCVSASRQVNDGVERRSLGFSYVQGSGDDHELWGMGLTPRLFWEYKNVLLSSHRDTLPSLVTNLVVEAKSRHHSDVWTTLPTSVAAVDGRLLVGTVSDMPSELAPTLPSTGDPVSFVVISTIPVSERATHQDNPAAVDCASADKGAAAQSHLLRLQLSEGKKDQVHFLQHVLPASTRFIKERLARGDAVCVCCDTGRDASVGVALAALQLFFDDSGKLLEHAATSASKESIRTRLQWIIASRPQANPSRATLKRVNEFLLSSPAFRRR